MKFDQEQFQTNKIQKILLELNKSGLSYLKYLQYPEAIDFFKKAQKIVNEELMLSTNNQKINQLAGVTYNNLACYYKKTKKPKVALSYLKKTLELQVFKINDWASTGSTHLNICAIYSSLGKHQQALNHVQLALQLLSKKIYKVDDKSEEAKSYWNVKMLCYYNKAIQQQYLKAYQLSLNSFTKAKEVAKIYGVNNVGIILNCDDAIARLQTVMANLKKKMMNLILKKKEADQVGHYDFMRHHRPITQKSKKQQRIYSHEKFRKVSYNKKSSSPSRFQKIVNSTKQKISAKPQLIEPMRKIVMNRGLQTEGSASTKFKSLKDFISEKYQTEHFQKNQ